MTTYRGNAIAVGILLIVCSAATILSALPVGSMLDSPDYLARLATNGGKVVLAALIEFVWAATAAGIAVGLYQVLRKHNRSLALGSVVGRTAEGVLVLVGTLSLLALLNVGQASIAAGPAAAPSFEAVGETSRAVRGWAHGFLLCLPFSVGVAMYCYALYRSRLVPRWLPGWGLIGAGLCLGATVRAGFTQEFGLTTLNTVLNMRIGLQEMVLGVWLITKGFRAVPTPAGSSVVAPGT